jgi:HSP20 family protein
MATPVRFDPFRELAGFQSEMSQLLNGLLEGNGRTTQAWVPALDVWETADELVFAFDLPGVEEDRIAVELEDDMLTVSAVPLRCLDRREVLADALRDRFEDELLAGDLAQQLLRRPALPFAPELAQERARLA